MPYTSLTALTALLGGDALIQITDRSSPPTGAIDPIVVSQALAGTDAAVDASLAVRYRLPLAIVPDVVVEIATAIAAYKLHRFTPEQKIGDDYQQALRDLKDIASGAKKLDVAGIEPPSSGANGVIVLDRDRPLPADTLRGFI